MVEMTEMQMTNQILELAQELGFETRRSPRVSSYRGFKQRLSGERRRTEAMRPDLVVAHDGRVVVVEVKRGQVLPGGVEQVLDYVDALDAVGVLCVPDSVFPNIASSVVQYADRTHIRICSFSEVGEVLRKLLSSASGDHSNS